MNLKEAKRLRRLARATCLVQINLYEIWRLGRTVNVKLGDKIVDFQYPDSKRLTKQCFRGTYRALKKAYV